MNYYIYEMRDGRKDIQKAYAGGDIKIKLYPQKDGDGFLPHIYHKGKLNISQKQLFNGMKVTEHYMKEPKGFTQISFGKKENYYDALLDLQVLETLVGPLIKTKSLQNQ
jgi:hypothetical protein